jgi:hypothetical protein
MHSTPAQAPSLQRSLARAAALVVAAALGACAPGWVAVYPAPPAPPVASPRFAERAPPAGRPDYPTTIRYIDNRVRYEDIAASFVIGPSGDMCYADDLYDYWCIPPKAVGEVRMDRYVELHCGKRFPGCAYKAPRAGGTGLREYANRVRVREPFEDRENLVNAFRHLIRLMGGTELAGDPFASPPAPSDR